MCVRARACALRMRLLWLRSRMRELGMQGTLVELPPDIGKLRDMQTLILSGWFVLASWI